MADGRTRSRKASPLWHSLCDEHGTDDGIDPRLFFGRTHQSENHRAKRLCVAAKRGGASPSSRWSRLRGPAPSSSSCEQTIRSNPTSAGVS